MVTVTIISPQKTLEVLVQEGTLVKDVLQSAGISFMLPCGGQGSCGKCLVEISGKSNVISEGEKKLLGEKHFSLNFRLACFCKVFGDVTIRILNSETNILTWAKIPAFKYTEQGLGFACDIGTTTIALRIYNRKTGILIAETAAENRQKVFGMDVISRIQACKEHGVKTLSQVVTRQIEEMLQDLMENYDITHLDEGVVTGNSTMLHIFEGLDPYSLSVAPFKMQSHFGYYSKKKIVGAAIYIPQCLGAYIGADTLCALLASGLNEEKGISLLADIGTNGEVVLNNSGKFICCSMAAGPAFEGIGLQSGMPAAKGAIYKAGLVGKKLEVGVIGGGKAIGICGSGIIDILSVLKQLHILQENGYLEYPYVIRNTSLSITPEDIRKIQLAKAAVSAGIYTLLQEEKIEPNEINHFYLAGGFGKDLNPESGAQVGLFPEKLKDKISFIGNAALGGAVMLLMNKSLRFLAGEICQKSREVELSKSSFFMDKYIECMLF